ncbi:MAG: esterase-like activity of phytase family protein [Caldilineae bacterium]|nr:esterase-like activity of phytase family protein [Chloroflexota bacterium]MCB9177784.1 esterase-like activity of phytase family protein [Caldilineae bacterium]
MHANPSPGLRPAETGRPYRAIGLLLTALAIALGPSLAGPAPGALGRAAAQTQPRLTVTEVALLGEIRLTPGGTVLGTPLGGLSGITWDPESEAYLALSDDRGSLAPARYYTLRLDLTDGRLEAGDLSFSSVVTLTDAAGLPFEPGSIDPEGIALATGGPLAGSRFVSSEGDADASPPIDPFLRAFDAAGRQQAALPVPDHFLPAEGGARGVRDNQAFEPLTVSPSGFRLYSGTENALVQDGPAAGPTEGSRSRVLVYGLGSAQIGGPAGRLLSEHVYPVAPIPVAPEPADGFADNGLVELTALDEAGTLLALERSYAVGVGNTVRLFETSVAGATDVSQLDALVDPVSGTPLPVERPMPKRLLADIASLGIAPDNLEGMTLGPTLPDGRRVLILVSDDNFNASQVTQLVALALTLETRAPEPSATASPGATPQPRPTRQPPATESGRLYLPLLLAAGAPAAALTAAPGEPATPTALPLPTRRTAPTQTAAPEPTAEPSVTPGVSATANRIDRRSLAAFARAPEPWVETVASNRDGRDGE